MTPAVMAMLGAASKIIERLIPDPQAQAKAQIDLATLAQSGQLAELNAAVQIILADASGNMLQRSWRPILMLTFGGLIVARWLGWSAPNLAPDEYAHLWNIVEIGIGGGVIGRTAEKIAPAIAGAFKK